MLGCFISAIVYDGAEGGTAGEIVDKQWKLNTSCRLS